MTQAYDRKKDTSAAHTVVDALVCARQDPPYNLCISFSVGSS